MSVNKWCRLWFDILDDPKVQMMCEAYQRRLILLFVIKGKGDPMSDETIAFSLRISPGEWLSTKAIFIDKGFIDKDNQLKNWEKRQYVSDSSTNRVRQFREMKRFRNVSETAPDTDTDTEKNTPLTPLVRGEGESEQVNAEKMATPRPPTKGESGVKTQAKTDHHEEFEQFWAVYPKKKSKLDAVRAWEKLHKAGKMPPIGVILAAVKTQKADPEWVKDEGKYVPYPATWLNGHRWEDSRHYPNNSEAIRQKPKPLPVSPPLTEAERVATRKALAEAMRKIPGLAKRIEG